jgi:hypothetical protein
MLDIEHHLPRESCACAESTYPCCNGRSLLSESHLVAISATTRYVLDLLNMTQNCYGNGQPVVGLYNCLHLTRYPFRWKNSLDPRFPIQFPNSLTMNTSIFD